MTARLLAFLVWAAVAATTVFWGLRLFVRSPAPPPQTVGATMEESRGDLTRVLGGAPVEAGPAPVQASNRFKLVGVVAPRPGTPPRVGVALIAVDDKPARAYRVGAPIDERLVVQSVDARSVSIGPRGEAAEVQLELPPLPPPATGRLPATAGAAPPPPQISPPAVPQPEVEAPQEASPGPPQTPQR
jgi:general secretion pathway protein C